MKLFLVSYNSIDEYSSLGVYDSREKAEKAIFDFLNGMYGSDVNTTKEYYELFEKKTRRCIGLDELTLNENNWTFGSQN